MMSIMDTCRKHGISLYEYIKDIFSGNREMTRLSILIAQKASVALFQNPVMPVIILDADFTDLRIYCLNPALIRANLVLKITGK
jgi:hypothetical protein